MNFCPFPREAVETCCYMVRCIRDASLKPVLKMAVLPSAQFDLTSASLCNTHLLLKPRAVTGCKYHWFNLRTLNEGTLLWLQQPLGFCNNYCSLHGYVCAPQASTSVPESAYRVSCEQEISYSVATAYWDDESRLGSKRHVHKQPLLQIYVNMTNFKGGPAKEKHTYFKTLATTKTVSLWRHVCPLINLYVPMKTSSSTKPIISGMVSHYT